MRPRNYGLLSFGNEAEEDEEEITKISMVRRDFHTCDSMRSFVEFQAEGHGQECPRSH